MSSALPKNFPLPTALLLVVVAFLLGVLVQKRQSERHHEFAAVPKFRRSRSVPFEERSHRPSAHGSGFGSPGYQYEDDSEEISYDFGGLGSTSQPNKYRSREIINKRRDRRYKAEQDRKELNRKFAALPLKKQFNVASVIDDMNHEGVVRVFMTASAAFGHYASTTFVLKRLAAIGFTGNFDVIIDERAHGAGAVAKVQKLFGQNFALNTGHGAADFTQGNRFHFPSAAHWTVVRTMAVGNTVNGQALNNVKYAVTGGIDHKQQRGIARADLHADYFLELQPFGWTQGDNQIQSLLRGGETTKLDDIVPSSFAPLKDRTFVLPEPPTAQSASITSLANNDVNNVAKDLAAAAVAGHILLAPVYGAVRFPDVAIQYSKALMAAQATKPKKAVILVVGGEDGAVVQSQRGHRSDFVFLPQNINNKLKKVALGSRLANQKHKVDVDNALAALGNDEVLLVDLESNIDPALFALVFSSGNLPAVFEGQGTVEMVLNLGKPYFHIPGKMYPGLPSTLSVVRKAAGNIEYKTNPITDLTQLILDCQSPTSAASRYFDGLKEKYHNGRYGKVEIGLRAIHELSTTAPGSFTNQQKMIVAGTYLPKGELVK